MRRTVILCLLLVATFLIWITAFQSEGLRSPMTEAGTTTTTEPVISEYELSSCRTLIPVLLYHCGPTG